MIKKLIILLIIFIFSIGFAAAGNNTTDENPTPINEKYSEKIVESEENGHLNTSFSDGSNGYCLEYGEKEAEIGNKFYVVNTSYAKNNIDNKSIADKLKVFFIEHYDFTQKMPPVYTQHIIWYFSDNFYHPISIGENMDMIDEIVRSTHKYPDFGFKIVNNTTKMYFNFTVLISQYLHHQNYFAYKIWFEKIKENITNNTNKTNKYQNNSSTNKNITVTEKNIKKIGETPIQKKNFMERFSEKKTGIGFLALCFAVIIIGIVFLIKRRKN